MNANQFIVFPTMLTGQYARSSVHAVTGAISSAAIQSSIGLNFQ